MQVHVTRERAEEVFIMTLVMATACVVVAGGGLVVIDAHAREDAARALRLRERNLLMGTGPQAFHPPELAATPPAPVYEVTAYSHGCALPRTGPERPPRPGANGEWPRADYTVAADTTLHPFGTEVLIENIGFRTVGDRGHAIKGRRLDVFMDTCKEARKFGRRWLVVHQVPPQTSVLGGQR